MKSKSNHDILTLAVSLIVALGLVGTGVAFGIKARDENRVQGMQDETLAASPTPTPKLTNDVHGDPEKVRDFNADPAQIAEDGNPALGDLNAPIYVVEYLDLECPYCKVFHENYFEQLKKDYIDTGKMRYVVKDFPLEVHVNSFPAANAASCVYEQNGNDAFFDFVKEAFARQSDWIKDHEVFADIVKGLGFDVKEFRQCFDDEKYGDYVTNDFNEADSLGIVGTPAFFVNGKPLVGLAPSYEEFTTAIDEIVSAQN
ncbi:DsbA family protein [candidate division WWE3 bacterium]|uniref:DsbA family protein n=1 Tax=candidate division WWE3 bacterium TaxID=2053526 RepID=A0A955RQM0_UNCKA|nr:DsbA family protein [candidate division WWE3 bacterium]